jgi:hypothetical protein
LAETKKRVYVAGPMSRIELFNFPMFDEVTEVLKDESNGFEVFNPADHDRFLLGKPDTWYPREEDTEGPWIKWKIEGGPSLRQMLGADLNWIAMNATHICMLPGWENSKGAQAEWALARALDLEMMYW